MSSFYLGAARDSDTIPAYYRRLVQAATLVAAARGSTKHLPFFNVDQQSLGAGVLIINLDCHQNTHQVIVYPDLQTAIWESFVGHLDNMRSVTLEPGLPVTRSLWNDGMVSRILWSSPEIACQVIAKMPTVWELLRALDRTTNHSTNQALIQHWRNSF